MLGTYIKQLQFPMLGGCNVNVSSEPSLAGLVQRYIVKRVKGIKVGPATREQRFWVYLRTRKVKAGAKPCLALRHMACPIPIIRSVMRAALMTESH